MFYLLHGAFDCDDSWSSVGRAGFILDNLIAAKKAKPMVVVMPAGHTGPFTFGRGGLPMDEFVKDFNGDILPYIEKNYRVHTDRRNRAIAGLSMGGAHTLSIAFPQLEKFAYIGVFSSGVFGIAGGGTGGGSPGTELGRAEQGEARQRGPEERPQARVVRHGQGGFPDRDLPGHGDHAQEARLRRGLQGDRPAPTRGSTGATT